MAIVSADQRETMVHSNEVFRADIDGVFMGLGRYQRYRRAVADKIQEVQADSTNAR
jgi:cytochrome oxidase Cu insertion factor (SCO1/SenC/PrrC family)